MGKDWPMMPLGEVLTERRETPSIDALMQGEIPIVAKIGFNDGQIQFREDGETKTNMILIRPGDLVVSGINAAKGAIAIYASENLCSVAATIHYGAYIPDKERVDITYLWRLLRSNMFRELLQEYVPGGIKTELKAKRLLLVPVPCPILVEQQRIVARIEELAAKLEGAQRLQQQSIIETQMLVAKTTQDIFLKGIAQGWPVRSLGDYVVDDCYGTSVKTTDDVSGTPVLGMKHIQNGRLEVRDIKYLHLNDKEREKLLLRKGDILVNRTNSAELVGKCAVFDLEGDYAFASYLIKLRLDEAQADPRLVAMYINSPLGREYMFNERRQMTGQANVNATKLKAMQIALPALPEQHRIVAYLDELHTKVDALKKFQTEIQKGLNALLPSILSKAFSGEL